MSAVRMQRAAAQWLLADRLANPAEAVRAVAGVQAQDPNAAALSIRVRTAGLTRADVERALAEERSIVRTWAMRGTIHLVPADDVRWLTELLAPRALTATHRRLGQLGVPESDRPRAVDTIREALGAHGPLTRAELSEQLARAGVDTEGQAAAHLPALAALEGHVCFGPPRRGKPTYVLLDDWLPPARPKPSREEAVIELTRRYLSAFGPAAPEDFASWSGLPLRDARAGWAALAPGAEAAPPTGDAAPVRLLPAFDTYLLGYRTRDLAVPAEHARGVWPGGGIVRPTVSAGGLALGTWRQRRAGSRVNVTVEPFPGVAIDERGLAEEVADVGRFLGADAVLDDARPPRPARQRSSGA